MPQEKVGGRLGGKEEGTRGEEMLDKGAINVVHAPWELGRKGGGEAGNAAAGPKVVKGGSGARKGVRGGKEGGRRTRNE